MFGYNEALRLRILPISRKNGSTVCYIVVAYSHDLISLSEPKHL